MISIVIVSWNTASLLRDCLKSIIDFPSTETTEVIVIDNASSDGSAQIVSNEFPQFKLLAQTKNLGYARANNLGFAHSIGDLVLTLNPDTLLQENSLSSAAKSLRSHIDWGAVGAKLVSPSGETQRSIRNFPTYRNVFLDLFGKGDYRANEFNYDLEQIARQPMGTFLMFKRQALRTVGDANAPFDEQFPIFFNEVDLLYRLSNRGWKCGYCPSAKVLHYGGESTKQVRKRMIWESHLSLIRYFRKHHTHGIEAIGYPFLAIAAIAGAFVRAKGYDAGFAA